jgi:hypothetical protein
MTSRGMFFLLLVILVGLVGVFVWPTPYRSIGTPGGNGQPGTEMRVNRYTGTIETRLGEGSWIVYLEQPEYDVRRDSGTGRAVGKALQAGEDIKKMHEVAKEATEH